MHLFCLIFDEYEALDLMGPVEFLARVPEVKISYVSFDGGMKRSKQGFFIKTKKLSKMPKESVLLLPGGQGTRTLVNDSEFISKLKECVLASQICLSVCTGSALIARTGELDGLKATSNKRSLEWVKSCGKAVKWQERARWVRAGKFLHSFRRGCWYGYGAWFYQRSFWQRASPKDRKRDRIQLAKKLKDR